MRCFPRRGRQQWVAFLLVVCLVGVYLAYRRLQESDTAHRVSSLDNVNIEHLQQQLQNRVHGNLKLPKQPVLMQNAQADKAIVDSAVDQYVKEDHVLPPVFPVGRVLENEDDYVTTDERIARLKLLLLTLSPSNWKTTLDPDEMILLAKSELSDLGVESKLTCKEIDNLKASYGRQQGFFGKKIIDYVKKTPVSDYVLKSVGRDQQLKIECMKMDYREDRCHLMGNYRLVKELVMFSVLEHPCIIKMEGFCLRGETIDPRVKMKGAIIVTEAGKQMQQDLYQLLSWETKVELVINLMELLLYLEESPIGSLSFQKLEMNDFVMLDSKMKLVDLDNLMIGERSCQHNEDCVLVHSDGRRKDIKCVDRVCKGRNLMNNLFLLQESVLTPLLKYNPSPEVQQVQESIKDLRLTPKEVISWFKKRKGIDIPIGQPKYDRHIGVEQDNRKEQEQVQRDAHPNSRKEGNVLGMEKDTDSRYSYSRQGNANFPGRFDYTCGKSRVSWGCVLTVKSLDEAKSLCDRDDECASFIVFSSNPENDAMMTMVMKNKADENPEANYGATLFRKNRRKQAAIERINAVANEGKQNNTLEKTEKIEKFDIKTCLTKAGNATKSARSRREKRLLTHLGLRGISETEWKTYAESSKISKYLGPSQLTSSAPGVKGGRFRFQFGSNSLGLKKGEFIAEMGPRYYHMAYLATYHLDRVLGLYHIPPSVARTVTVSELKSIQGDKFPLKTFLNITNENSLRGVLTVPMPPVMKTNDLTIEKKDSLVTSVPEFDRNQKVQIEYILLWSLTKMMQPQHGYLGYKGHLIHFEADLAFQSLQRSLTGFFYNCQFPNAVYKTLVCYKCLESRKSSNVCGLGFEVVRRIKNNGYSASEISIGSLMGNDIINVIDSSASTILQVVEQCIKTFSREKVLY